MWRERKTIPRISKAQSRVGHGAAAQTGRTKHWEHGEEGWRWRQETPVSGTTQALTLRKPLDNQRMGAGDHLGKL